MIDLRIFYGFLKGILFTLWPNSNFCSEDSTCTIIAGKWQKKKKNNRKAKVKSQKSWEKPKFQPFQDRKWNRKLNWIVRALDHNVQRRIFSVWLKRLWSEDGSSLSSRPSNKSINDNLRLSASEEGQSYLLKPYDSDRILTRQASSRWNGIKAHMLHRKFCSLLIDDVITRSIK